MTSSITVKVPMFQVRPSPSTSSCILIMGVIDIVGRPIHAFKANRIWLEILKSLRFRLLLLLQYPVLLRKIRKCEFLLGDNIFLSFTDFLGDNERNVSCDNFPQYLLLIYYLLRNSRWIRKSTQARASLISTKVNATQRFKPGVLTVTLPVS